MPLSKLIGLEILKLHGENDELLSSIATYEKVLADVRELYKVIKARLRKYKKQFSRERKTELADVVPKAYIEEVKIEDIYVCIDRFGYMKAMDEAAFVRASDEAKQEYPHIIKMKNTDKVCLFTDQGNMHQVRADRIPKCKIKDKGALVHTLCKLSGDEEALLYIPFEDLFESMLLFTTKGGYIKLVSGAEFETNRSQVAATKLEQGDEVSGVVSLTASDVLSGMKKVILITEKKLSLGLPLSEVSELKKTSRGVRAILLDKDDKLVFSTVVDANAETFSYKGKELNAKRVRNRRRAAKGQKANLD